MQSDDALRRTRQAVRRCRPYRQTHVTLADVARLYNSGVRFRQSCCVISC